MQYILFKLFCSLLWVLCNVNSDLRHETPHRAVLTTVLFFVICGAVVHSVVRDKMPDFAAICRDLQGRLAGRGSTARGRAASARRDVGGSWVA